MLTLFESIAVLVIPFTVGLVITPWISRKFLDRGISARDIHKPSNQEIPEMGGVSILLSVLAGFVALIILIPEQALTILWIALSLALMSAVGAIDDIFGLRQRHKLVLTLFAALPVVASGSYATDIFLPGLGYVSLGLVYALVLIPVGVAVTANLANMYAGFNGLETGVCLISLFFTSAVIYLVGRRESIPYLLPLMGGMAAFLIYNRYPSSVFPGDTGTLLMGAGVGIAAILGGVEFFAVLIFLPLILDFLFKARISFSTSQLGHSSLNDDSTLTPAPYMSLTHQVMKVLSRERKLVHGLWGISALCGLAAVLLALILPGSGVLGIIGYRNNPFHRLVIGTLPVAGIILSFRAIVEKANFSPDTTLEGDEK